MYDKINKRTLSLLVISHGTKMCAFIWSIGLSMNDSTLKTSIVAQSTKPRDVGEKQKTWIAQSAFLRCHRPLQLLPFDLKPRRKNAWKQRHIDRLKFDVFMVNEIGQSQLIYPREATEWKFNDEQHHEPLRLSELSHYEPKSTARRLYVVRLGQSHLCRDND